MVSIAVRAVMVGGTSGRTIAVAGNMGSGKSSLVTWLEQQFDLVPFHEGQDQNPYLADFYGDMPRWALQSQLFFLTRRHFDQKRMELEQRAVVQDRTIYEDAEVFAANLHAEGTIDDRDWALYQDLYRAISADLRPPDLLIYARCPLRTIRKRIRLRGRPYEASLPPRYLRRLQDLYDAWFARYDRSPTLVLDTDKLDYVEDLFSRREVMGTIRASLDRLPRGRAHRR